MGGGGEPVFRVTWRQLRRTLHTDFFIRVSDVKYHNKYFVLSVVDVHPSVKYARIRSKTMNINKDKRPINRFQVNVSILFFEPCFVKGALTHSHTTKFWTRLN